MNNNIQPAGNSATPATGQPVTQSAPQQTPSPVQNNQQLPYETIFCATCGTRIAKAAVQCPHCGTPVYQNQDRSQPQQIVINNNNNNVNSNINAGVYAMKRCDKWVALLLCIFLGWCGAHKFYEGKTAMGILYLFTLGTFGFGILIDLIIILTHPNPYYV